jgi:microcompartment protein CcmK/EutM
MRFARVIAKVVLNRKLDEILPGSYLVVRTCNRGTLAGQNQGNAEELVLYDNLGAREGDMVGLVEGAEATNPFRPRKVPYDCCNACIIDTINFRPVVQL